MVLLLCRWLCDCYGWICVVFLFWFLLFLEGIWLEVVMIVGWYDVFVMYGDLGVCDCCYGYV